MYTNYKYTAWRVAYAHHPLQGMQELQQPRKSLVTSRATGIDRDSMPPPTAISFLFCALLSVTVGLVAATDIPVIVCYSSLLCGILLHKYSAFFTHTTLMGCFHLELLGTMLP